MESIQRIAKNIVADIDKNQFSSYAPVGDQPAVYVGTYRKYNEGNLDGMWVGLTNFSDYDEFVEWCQDQLHSDEQDPELMFQDYQNFPETYYGESSLDKELWDYIDKVNDYDKDQVDAILQNGYDLDDVEEFAFYSDCVDRGDLAEKYIDEIGGVQNLERETLESYFDYDSYGRDLQMGASIIRYDGGFLVKWY